MQGADQAEMHYGRFGLMILLSYVVMFAFMYAMVDRWANVYPNLNQAYMAGLMAAPMALLELVLMGMMYPNRRLNLIIGASAAVVLIASFFAIRMQTGIGDSQFLRSMIPHHSGAILMCKEATISNPDIQVLCRNIIEGQQDRIGPAALEKKKTPRFNWRFQILDR